MAEADGPRHKKNDGGSALITPNAEDGTAAVPLPTWTKALG
ncbi:hypothetical protein ABZO31_21975 [Streptomyces sp. HUAS MG47]